jgi:hypothetical protein
MNLQEQSVHYISNYELTSKPKYFVYWMLGNFCPHSCSYCPEALHSGSKPYHDYDTVIRTINKFPANSLIMFGGGEPTYHPDFEKILDNKPKNISIGILSNGARPIDFWERISDKVTNVILSYHAEFAILDRFVQTAKLVYHTKKRFGRINLVMNPKRWDECVNVYDTLVREHLPVTAKPVVDNFGSFDNEILMSSEYNTEQIVWLNEITKLSKNTHKFIGIYDKNHNLLDRTTPSELLSLGQTNFKNWTCHAPAVSREIMTDGTVITTGCNQKEMVGNIFTDFTVDSEPIICNQTMCWCHADIQSLKIKPS